MQIEGKLTLCHVTLDPGGRRVCGGRFEPTSDADRRKLDELVAAFETPRQALKRPL